MITALFLNLFKRRRDDENENEKNVFNLAKNSRPINIIFPAVILLNMIFIAIPVIIKIPAAKLLVNWYLKDAGNMQGDFTAAIATILGTLLAVTGAIWAQSYFDAQKEKRLIKVILTQIYEELENISDRANEGVNLIYEIAKEKGITSEKAESTYFKLSEYEDLKTLSKFVKSAWESYKGDIIVLFNDEKFIKKIIYLYSVLDMVGNYPYISVKHFAMINKKSIDLQVEVTKYLDSFKKNNYKSKKDKENQKNQDTRKNRFTA